MDLTPLLCAIEADHLGTPRLVTDALLRERWRWDSTPFGDVMPDADPAGVGALTLNLRFPGQYYDAESGLYYNYFRTYDPATGRYVESDPIGLAGGINTYGYVGGNPLSAVDPDGQFALPFWMAGGGAPSGAATGSALQRHLEQVGKFQRPLDALLGNPNAVLSESSSEENSESSTGKASGGKPTPASQPTDRPKNLPESDRCKKSEWEFCYRKCGGRPKTNGCYVSLKWNYKKLIPGRGSILEEERIVNCNCDDGCP